jgi:hypothetical protein
VTNVTRPFLGVPADSGNDCVYAAALDALRCTNPAVLHIVIADPGWYEGDEQTSVRTCLDHAGYARAIPGVLTEHVFTDACADPDSILIADPGKGSHCHIEQPA